MPLDPELVDVIIGPTVGFLISMGSIAIKTLIDRRTRAVRVARALLREIAGNRGTLAQWVKLLPADNSYGPTQEVLATPLPFITIAADYARQDGTFEHIKSRVFHDSLSSLNLLHSVANAEQAFRQTWRAVGRQGQGYSEMRKTINSRMEMIFPTAQ